MTAMTSVTIVFFAAVTIIVNVVAVVLFFAVGTVIVTLAVAPVIGVLVGASVIAGLAAAIMAFAIIDDNAAVFLFFSGLTGNRCRNQEYA